MKIFACWTCKEFGHFLSCCPRRVKKIKSSKPYKSRIHKDFPFSSDEEFDAALEEFLSESDNESGEIGFFGMKEEMVLVAIIDDYSDKDIDMKTNQENVEIVLETNNYLQNNMQTVK